MNAVTKNCSCCLNELTIDFFHPKKSGKYGVDRCCKKCCGTKNKMWREKNVERQKVYSKAYRSSNIDRIRASNKENYWKRKTKDPEGLKTFNRDYMRNRLRSDIPFRLLASARNRLWYVLKGTAIKGRTVDLLGCTPEELKTHIEKQFQAGWTWADWGTIFEIDHIKPCSKFDMENFEQRKACFHYSNLRPLLKLENRRKWAYYTAA